MTTITYDQQRQGLRVHEMTATATDEEVRRIMALSAEVFSPHPADPNTHTSFEFWRRRLSLSGAHIVWISTSTDLDTPLGFFFSFPRVYDELGGETFFIWLAGVAEDARGLGIFPMLLEKTVQHARALGHGLLSVNTVPATFGKMFRILQANSWEVVVWRESELGPKVLMKLVL